MRNFKQKLISFMYGRYGADHLYYALTAAWIVFWVLSVVTHHMAFAVISWAVFIYMTFRVFSRNIARRRRENELFLKVWNPIVAFCKLQYHRVRDCRTSVYRKCPQCRAVLRLPHRRGTHTANCPRCAKRFSVKVLF